MDMIKQFTMAACYIHCTCSSCNSSMWCIFACNEYRITNECNWWFYLFRSIGTSATSFWRLNFPLMCALTRQSMRFSLATSHDQHISILPGIKQSLRCSKLCRYLINISTVFMVALLYCCVLGMWSQVGRPLRARLWSGLVERLQVWLLNSW